MASSTISDRHSASAIDVVAVMDAAPFRGVPLYVASLMLLAMVFDGFDIQAIAFVAPKLLEEFSITRPQLGPVLAAGLIGMAVGAFLLGPVGDRRGRRLALTISLLIIAVMSLGAVSARSLGELTAWRFATGVGLGGVIPNCTALMLEYAPRSVRNLIVALTTVGVPIGGVLGAEVAAHVIPAFGWRAVFVIGALLPAGLAVAIWLTLPESPRYLAKLAGRGAELARILNRVTGRSDFAADTRFAVIEPESVGERAGVATLLSPQFRRDTLALWVMFATNIFAVYAFFNWLPVVLSAAGLSLGVALRGALIFNLGGVAGALLISLVMSRYGSRWVLRCLALAAIVTTASMSLLPIARSTSVAGTDGVAGLLVLMGLAGACILGLQICIYIVTANAYPTAIRASGVGWASAVARLGGVVSGFAGGALLALGQGARPFFLSVATILIPLLIGAWFLGRHVAPTMPARGP